MRFSQMPENYTTDCARALRCITQALMIKINAILAESGGWWPNQHAGACDGEDGADAR